MPAQRITKRKASKKDSKSMSKKPRNTDLTGEKKPPVRGRYYIPIYPNEMKYATTTANQAAVASSGIAASFFTPINWAVTGTSVTNCTGWEYICKYISFRYMLRCSDATNAVRIMLVRHVDSGGAYPVLTELLTNGSNVDPSLISTYNDSKKEKYTVLYDKLHLMTLAGDSSTAQGSLYHTCNLPVKKNSDNGADGSYFEDGSLYIVAFSDSSAATHPNISWLTRVGFTDN